MKEKCRRIIIRVLKSERGLIGHCWLRSCRKAPRTKKFRQCEKDTGTNSSLEPPEETQPHHPLIFISAKSIQDFWFPEISDYVFVLRHLVYGNLLEQQWEINTVNDWAVTLQRQAETTLQTYRSPLHNVSKYSLKCIIFEFIYENMY